MNLKKSFKSLLLGALIAGSCAIVISKPVKAAGNFQVGSETYSTLQEAIDNAPDNGIIKMLASTTDANTAVNTSKTLVFDLNGCTYASTGSVCTLENQANMLITNSNAGAVAAIMPYGASTNVIQNIGGTLTIAGPGGNIQISGATDSGIYNTGELYILNPETEGSTHVEILNCANGICNDAAAAVASIENLCSFDNNFGVYVDENGLFTMGTDYNNGGKGSGAFFENTEYDFKNIPKTGSVNTIQLTNCSSMAHITIDWLNGSTVLPYSGLLLDKRTEYSLKAQINSLNVCRNDDMKGIERYSNVRIHGNSNAGILVNSGIVSLTGSPFNTHFITFETVWMDNSDEAGLRPSSYSFKDTREDHSVEIYKRGAVYKVDGYTTVFEVPTVNSTNPTNVVKQTFAIPFIYNDAGTKKEIYQGETPAGQKIYTPTAKATSGGTTSAALNYNLNSKNTITYTLEDPDPVKINLKINVIWKDDSDKKGQRPDSVEAHIYKNDETTYTTQEINKAGSWTKTLEVSKYAPDAKGYDTNKLNTFNVKQRNISYYKTTYPENVVTATQVIAEIDNEYNGDNPHPVEISVVGPSGEPVKNSVVTILDESGTVYYQGQTNSSGKFTANVVPGKYTLRQDTVPDGYILNKDIYSFTMAESGNTTGTTKIVDDITRVIIKRINTATKELVAGASLRLRDSNGNVIDEWTSGTSGHEINGKLAAGKKYYVSEMSAPSGYPQATEVSFDTHNSGATKEVLIGSAGISPTPTKVPTTTPSNRTPSATVPTRSGASGGGTTGPTATRGGAGGTGAEDPTGRTREKTPQTGDASKMRMYFVGMIAALIALGAGFYLLYIKNKEEKQLSYLADLKGVKDEDDVSESTVEDDEDDDDNILLSENDE